MRRIPLVVLSLLLGLLLLVALLVQVGAPPPPPGADGQVRVTQVDASAYPQVSLYTTVGDPAGGQRTNLTRSDFQIIEDGTPVDLTGFVGAGGSTVSTALVIDRSGSMEDAGKIAGARDAADAFVDLLRPGDHAALISFNHTVQVAEAFTADHAILQSAIDRLQPNGGTALYDSIIAGVDLLRVQPGRRVLLVLTDGQDCRDLSDCPHNAGSSHSLSEAIRYATAAGQAVYVVGLGERDGSGNSGIDEGVLRQIAADTDGTYFYSPNAAALANLYTSLAGSLQREYRLTYTSPRPFYDGTRRDIRVMVAGASAGAGYTEQHLINVTSSPLVGAGLLLPLLGLLFIPGLIASRRRRAHAEAVAAAAIDGPPLESSAEALAAGARCASCAEPLRLGARFCGRCGATQPTPLAMATASERRSFCDMCGRPLLPGAEFCRDCGEPAGARNAKGAEGAEGAKGVWIAEGAK